MQAVGIVLPMAQRPLPLTKERNKALVKTRFYNAMSISLDNDVKYR